MKEVFLAGLCRTPVGNFGGTLKDIPAVQLGEIVMKEAINRAGIKAEQVDEVFFGCVLGAGLGQNPARQAAVKAGVPVESPATTINKVCGSGLHSVTLAFRAIQAGDAECVLAGGTESMSLAPYILPGMRWGARMGNAQAVDAMINDGLWEAFNNYHMGVTAENVAAKFGVTREMQDEFAAVSQQRASAAVENGVFDAEITPVTIPQRKGDPVVFARDEYPRKGTTAESLSKLKPAFAKEGTVTAGNASGINDGAAALIVCSKEFAEKNGLKPMLKLVSTGSVGVDPTIMGIGPVPSVKKAVAKAGLKMDDIDLFELNEAFAAQAVAVGNELGVTSDKVNVNGGAIAIGHPIGASGARILVTLAYEMQRRGSKYGVASLCIGGGMGEAVVVELCK